jgi:hypothetical protein
LIWKPNEKNNFIEYNQQVVLYEISFLILSFPFKQTNNEKYLNLSWLLVCFVTATDKIERLKEEFFAPKINK